MEKIQENVESPKSQKKAYGKPTLKKQPMFERFALACTSKSSGCQPPNKNQS